MSTKKRNSRNNRLAIKESWTISELQMWIHGAHSMQGNDWVPTADQWKIILDIIFRLKDDATVSAHAEAQVPAKTSTTMTHTVPLELYQPPQSFMVPQQPAYDLQMPELSNPLLSPDEIPAEANLSIDDLNRLNSLGAIPSGKTHKTPHIDTSKGSYVSPY